MMELKNIQSAQDYYNHGRRRSFFFSRLFVMFSMVILLIVLGINVSILSSQNTNTSSHASSDEETMRALPSPPAGCEYHKVNGALSILCSTPTPKKDTQNDFSLVISLPELPLGCHFQTTQRGYKLSCAQSQSSINPSVVTLPGFCHLVTNLQDKSVVCTNPSGQTQNVPLPPLPQGCDYQRGESILSVVCHQ